MEHPLKNLSISKLAKFVLMLLPGIFFFSLSAALVIAPDALRYFLIGGFFTFGVVFTFLGVKLIQLNARVHHIVNNLKDQVVVQSFQVAPHHHSDSSDEKIILH